MKQILRMADFSAVSVADPDAVALTPRAVRELVLREHVHLRQLLNHAVDAARKVSAGCMRADDLEAMRGTARAAYKALVAHTELEDRLLAPVLETIDAWGRVRSEELRCEHVLQRRALSRALGLLELSRPAAAVLAASIEDLLNDVERDMDREESELLSSDLLLDEMISVNASGG